MTDLKKTIIMYRQYLLIVHKINKYHMAIAINKNDLLFGSLHHHLNLNYAKKKFNYINDIYVL